MDAFLGIGAKGSTSLAVVAPGIAEALIATAIGLFAAIPAAIFYNILLNKVRGQRRDLEGFSTDLMNLMSRGRVQRSGKIQNQPVSTPA
jgi:biopolymer transport protein TolQ